MYNQNVVKTKIDLCGGFEIQPLILKAEDTWLVTVCGCNLEMCGTLTLLDVILEIKRTIERGDI